MRMVWYMELGCVGVLCVVLVSVSAYSYDDEETDYYPRSPAVFDIMNRLGSLGRRSMDKRGGQVQAVMFKCTRKTAKCYNNGIGPKVTLSKASATKATCVCMCPYGYNKPQCRREWWMGTGEEKQSPNHV